MFLSTSLRQPNLQRNRCTPQLAPPTHVHEVRLSFFQWTSRRIPNVPVVSQPIFQLHLLAILKGGANRFCWSVVTGSSARLATSCFFLTLPGGRWLRVSLGKLEMMICGAFRGLLFDIHSSHATRSPDFQEAACSSGLACKCTIYSGHSQSSPSFR
jgi:hypothetical protein